MNDSPTQENNAMFKSFVEWIELLRPILSGIDTHTFDGTDYGEMWYILRRGVVIRQFEALEAIKKMVEQGCGHFAVVLLRPAYEEFIWIK
jgi:hypothetical protein